ncbi:MAG: phosphohydrolase, partial [Acinetobacter junii]
MYSSDTVIFIFYAIFALLALWGLIQAWIHQSRTETIHPFKAFIHLLAFYLSYLL